MFVIECIIIFHIYQFSDVVLCPKITYSKQRESSIVASGECNYFWDRQRHLADWKAISDIVSGGRSVVISWKEVSSLAKIYMTRKPIDVNITVYVHKSSGLNIVLLDRRLCCRLCISMHFTVKFKKGWLNLVFTQI